MIVKRLTSPYLPLGLWAQLVAIVLTCGSTLLAACDDDDDVSATTDGGAANTDGGPLSRAGGNGGGGRSGVGGSVAEQQFVSRYAETVCTAVPPCCKDRGFPYDKTRCMTVVMGFAQAQLNETRVNSRRYDPLEAGRCLAAIQASGKSCRALVALDDEEDACDGVFTGSAKPGEPCKTSGDCMPTTEGKLTCFYDLNVSGDKGVCQVRKIGEVGDLCGAPTGTAMPVDCPSEADLYCGGTPSTCRELPQAGESCFLFCAKSSFCNAGACVARTGAGAPCETQNPFAPTCAEGLFCDPSAKACAAKRTPGAACAGNEECQSGNCKAQICSKDTRAAEAQLTNLVTLFCSP